ncbi:hypothetical protein F4805DRAFT_455282 [Annulohypoxylon moriforme]|nr:hypothetical protein F4805DRAFT_455282 [Annulohypoxylon moriforme]
MPPVSRVIYTVPPPPPPPPQVIFVNARDAPGPPSRPLPRPPTRPRPRPQPPMPRPGTGEVVVLEPATLLKPATVLRPVNQVVPAPVVDASGGRPLVPVVNVSLGSAPDGVLLRRVA